MSIPPCADGIYYKYQDWINKHGMFASFHIVPFASLKFQEAEE